MGGFLLLRSQLGQALSDVSLADGTSDFLGQPSLDALWVEYVAAGQLLDHFSVVEVFEANHTSLGLLLGHARVQLEWPFAELAQLLLAQSVVAVE